MPRRITLLQSAVTHCALEEVEQRTEADAATRIGGAIVIRTATADLAAKLDLMRSLRPGKRVSERVVVVRSGLERPAAGTAQVIEISEDHAGQAAQLRVGDAGVDAVSR